jgi:putative flavoprotein involved in K+ transport
VSGLGFVGLPWLYKRKSALLLGVGEDAEHVVSAIVCDSTSTRRLE